MPCRCPAWWTTACRANWPTSPTGWSVTGVPWDQVLQQLGHEQEARARAEEDPRRARDTWHVAAACLVFAQMAFNADDERKCSLYAR